MSYIYLTYPNELNLKISLKAAMKYQTFELWCCARITGNVVYIAQKQHVAYLNDDVKMRQESFVDIIIN